jgi:hypothetical protein
LLILQEKFFRLCTGFFALLDIDEKLRMRFFPFADPSQTLRISSGLRLRASAQGFCSGSEWQKVWFFAFASEWQKVGFLACFHVEIFFSNSLLRMTKSRVLRIAHSRKRMSFFTPLTLRSEWQKSRTLCYRSGWHEKVDWHKKILSYPSFNKITFSDMKKESDTKKLRITLPENIKKKFLHHPFELLLFLFSYTIHFWMCKLSLNLPLDWLSALVLF